MSTTFEILPFEDANTRLEDALSVFQGSYSNVLLFDHDLTLEGDFLSAIGSIIGNEDEPDVIVVKGALTVNGRISLYESTPSLLVLGPTRAQTLEGGDAEVYIGDGKFDYLVYGYYNDGILETGTVTVPWVINSDHDLRVDAPDATWIDNHGEDDDDYDFGGPAIMDAFVPEVVKAKDAQIDIGRFLEHLRAGKPVLKAKD